MAKYADLLLLEVPKYSMGNAIMLSTRNVQMKRPSKKLDHRFIGPFQVEKVISPSAVHGARAKQGVLVVSRT